MKGLEEIKGVAYKAFQVPGTSLGAAAVLAGALTTPVPSSAADGENTYSPDEVRDILEQRDEEIVVFFDQGIPCPSAETDDICVTQEAVIAYSEENNTMSLWRGDFPRVNETLKLGASSEEYRLQLEIEQAEYNNFGRQRAFGSDHSFVVQHDFSQEAANSDCMDVPNYGLFRDQPCSPYSEIIEGVRNNMQVTFRGVITESNRKTADIEENALVSYAISRNDEGRFLIHNGVTLNSGASITAIPGAKPRFTDYGENLARGEEPLKLTRN